MFYALSYDRFNVFQAQGSVGGGRSLDLQAQGINCKLSKAFHCVNQEAIPAAHLSET